MLAKSMSAAARRAAAPLVLGALLCAAVPAAADLIINELLADPARDWDGDGQVSAVGDEWVEVYNRGPEALDLSGYRLRDGTGGEYHLVLGGQLPAGEAAVFYGSDALAWQAALGLTATGLSLNNAGDIVELLFVGELDATGTVVHSVAYLDHEAEDDRSSGWGYDSGGWCLFDGLNPYGGTQWPGSSGCDPTPGTINFCTSSVPVHEVSWDQVKALYR